MSTFAERQRNNVRAGAFVTITIILGLAVIIILTDVFEALFRSTNDYTVTFDVSSGVANLKKGSDVRVGGVALGEVTDVRPKFSESDAFREIAVDFELDRRVNIFANAKIIVSYPLIGSEAWLDIPNVGDPNVGRPATGQLLGTPSVGLLTSLLGADNADKTDEIVENARVFSGFLSDVPHKYDNQIAPMLNDWRIAAGDVRGIVGDFRQMHWPTWAESLDRVFTWAAQTTTTLDKAIADGHGLLAESRAVVAENRQPILSLIANVQAASQRLNEETLDKLHAVLESGEGSLNEATAALEQLRVDYDAWATNIGEALANANLAAGQLKLTMTEVRRSPWKVLYRPSSDELEHELLYEAARSFAVAAADLKAASTSVQRVLDNHGDRIAENEELYQRLERNLIDSLAKYEKAQQQLLDVLVSDSARRK